jgi:NADPH2:quinone reductase
VQGGETVVVLGAAGGLGSAMVQLAVAQGSTVVAVVGSEDKAAFATSLGAQHVAVHSGDDVATAVRAAIGSTPVDVVLDPVQGAMGPQSRALLRPNGRWVLCGHAGTLRPIDPSFYMQNLTLVGATLGGYDRDTMRAMEQETQDAVVQLWQGGRFKSVTTQSIEFGDVPEALTAMSRRETIGRVVVHIP